MFELVVRYNTFKYINFLEIPPMISCSPRIKMYLLLCITFYLRNLIRHFITCIITMATITMMKYNAMIQQGSYVCGKDLGITILTLLLLIQAMTAVIALLRLLIPDAI